MVSATNGLDRVLRYGRWGSFCFVSWPLLAEWAKLVSAVNALVRVAASSRHEINWFHPMRLAGVVFLAVHAARGLARGKGGCAEMEVSFSFPCLGGVFFIFSCC